MVFLSPLLLLSNLDQPYSSLAHLDSVHWWLCNCYLYILTTISNSDHWTIQIQITGLFSTVRSFIWRSLLQLSPSGCKIVLRCIVKNPIILVATFCPKSLWTLNTLRLGMAEIFHLFFCMNHSVLRSYLDPHLPFSTGVFRSRDIAVALLKVGTRKWETEMKK